MKKLVLGVGLLACYLGNEALAQTPPKPNAKTTTPTQDKKSDKPQATPADTPDIYDVNLNQQWQFSSLVMFDDTGILLPLKYLPSDLLGNITDTHFVTVDGQKYIHIETAKIVKKDVENLAMTVNLSEDYFKDNQHIAIDKNKKGQSLPIDAIYANYDINMSNEFFKSTRATFSTTYASKHNWTLNNQMLWDGKAFNRVSTTWQKQYKDNSTLIVGDTGGTTINGFNSVNFFGVRYATPYFNSSQFLDNSLPLLPLSGFAVTPSKLDLYINNQLVQQSEIATGKYNLNIPYQNRGYGVAQATVVDITGKPVSVSVPFYSSSDIIRKGDNEYDVSTGLIRKNVGTSSFDYSSPIVNALYKGGWAEKYTQDAFVELSPIYSAGSLLGHWVPIPQLGMVNLGVSVNSQKQLLYRLGYERSSTGFSAGFDYQKSSEFCFGFGQICLNQQFDLFAGTTLPWKLGNVNVSYIKRATTTGVQNVSSLQWNKQITKNINMYTNFTNVTGTTKSNSLYVGVSINFDHHIYSSSSLTKDNTGNGFQESIYRGEDDQHPQYGYGSATFNKTSSDQTENFYYGAHLNRFAYQVNLYKDNQGTTGNADVSGGIVYLPSENFVALTKQVQSGLAYVKIDNLSDPIAIDHENRFSGYTDKQGRMIVPDAVALNNEKVTIDINKLNKGLTLDQYEKEFYVPFSGAVKVEFKAKPLPYTVHISGVKGGSIFNMGNDAYVVGDDGYASVEASGHAVLPMDGDKTCQLDISPKQKEYLCK